jgi:hypothetical protein
MENVLVSLVCIAMILMGTATMAMSSLNSMSLIADSIKDEEKITSEIRNTNITPVSATVFDNGSRVEIMLKNDGTTDLANYKAWDVILRFQDNTTQWVPYSWGAPGWTVGGIYYNGSPEIYNPNICNPMETIKLVVRLSPPAVKNANNLATISTPNGVLSQVGFSYR